MVLIQGEGFVAVFNSWYNINCSPPNMEDARAWATQSIRPVWWRDVYDLLCLRRPKLQRCIEKPRREEKRLFSKS